MLFNSYIFIFLFLPLALLGYFVLNHFKKYEMAEYFLIFMSLWFYAYFNVNYLPIILISIVANYVLGKKIKSSTNAWLKKVLLLLGIIGNVGILFYYKYTGFFIQNINYIFKTNFHFTAILLPLGISFFTFQQLSYLIDNYKNEIKSYSFRQYALFVCFFPQLIAGPIVLHHETIPQFDNPALKKWNWHNFSLGITAFAFGLSKKVLIADTFGNAVNYGFAHIDGLGSINAIFVMLAYTFQIYFDFSGYCDMATGIAKMFNIDLPINFNSPYQALTVTDFWKRWHITLTRFLRTYIYFPLGGNRKGTKRTYINLFIVFLISGIWHGANYTFIIWGILHGVMMVYERINKTKVQKIHPALSWLITFLFVNLTWVIFRADTVHDAILLFKQIFYFNFTPLSNDMINAMQCYGLNFFIWIISNLSSGLGYYLSKTCPVYLVFITLFILLKCKNTNERIKSFKPNLINAVITAFLLFFSIISLSGISTFLYFNF